MTIVMRLTPTPDFSTKTSLSVRLQLLMSFLVSLKVVRLLLAVSVSIWLAGGCLFGCGSMAMAASETTQTAVEGESCHTISSQAGHAHDCCAKPKPRKQTQVKLNPNQKLAAVSSLPTGMMSECPLMIGATAVVSKNSNSPELVGVTTAALPLAISVGELTQRHIVDPFLPNRGPTYLRCCVFLI